MDPMSNLLGARLPDVPMTRIVVPSGGASLIVYATTTAVDDKPPLVFLHAAVSDSRLWTDQFAAFGRTHRLVAYDRRGFGATAAVDEPFSSVDDLWAVMNALDIERAVLVGCSQGGRIAIDATLERPDRVAALVLVGAAISGAPEGPHDPRLDALIAEFETAQADDDLDRQNRIEAHVWLDGPFAPDGRVGDPQRALFLAMNRIALTGSKHCQAEVPDPAYDRLAEIRVPTLVLWGPLDVPSVIVNMQHAAATIPGARACELDAVAHLPSLEAPERFNAALSSFVASLVPGPDAAPNLAR